MLHLIYRFLAAVRHGIADSFRAQAVRIDIKASGLQVRASACLYPRSMFLESVLFRSNCSKIYTKFPSYLHCPATHDNSIMEQPKLEGLAPEAVSGSYDSKET